MGGLVVGPFNPEKREECGIIAIYSKRGKDVAPLLYRALMALQHRGQDAAGFAIFDGRRIEARRGVGLVSDIFKSEDLLIRGTIGIGHTRYPTIGQCRQCDVQPTIHKGIAVAHNGHVANYDILKSRLEGEGYGYTSTVDSEPMAFVLDRHGNDIDGAVKEIHDTFEGSFSDVFIKDGVLGVTRDRFSIRPLVWGEDDDFICFASESVALDINGIKYKGEVTGGQLITIKEGAIERRQITSGEPKHCMFEYVYFSRPDSMINGRSVYEARRRLGTILAQEAPVQADVVVPVPDTSRTAALTYSNELGIPYDEGLIKNRYIGRTFIMPSQEKRRDAVRIKLNPVRDVVEGKKVVLVDDSIVRGTTLKEIVSLVRGAGAREIHIRITCPPLKAPCFYGVDMSTYSELIANRKSVDGTREFLGADSLAYISVEGLSKAIGTPICSACLGGEYHTSFVKELARLARERDG